MKNNNRSLRRGFKQRRDYWETMAVRNYEKRDMRKSEDAIAAVYKWDFLVQQTGGPCR